MKPSRFTEEQIIGILREQEAGAATADICRKHGISNATFYKWKAKYGGLEVSDAKRLKTLEDENAKLKKLLAEAMLDNAMLKDVAAKKMVTPAARREAVAHLRSGFDVSKRRACGALGADRSSVRYRARRPGDEAVRRRLRELAAVRRRFGYRRLLVLMHREGLVMNHKKFRRLYRKERLQVRSMRPVTQQIKFVLVEAALEAEQHTIPRCQGVQFDPPFEQEPDLHLG
jgi:putative transposase